jgi:hypothetical protein
MTSNASELSGARLVARPLQRVVSPRR